MYLSTPETVEHIRRVIRETETPSWLSSVKRNFGGKGIGTIKADQWRTFCTVHIALALISLWGQGTTHASPHISGRLRKVLDHTMELVCAVRLACLRKTSRDRAKAYLEHITKYVKDLKTIHPDAKYLPNMHLAFHIYDFLLLFGPVHSWWCFPFERLIGILQRMRSNHKLGEMESTVLQSFFRAAKIRHWLARPDCPPAIKECKELFDKHFTHARQDNERGNPEQVNDEDVFVHLDQPLNAGEPMDVDDEAVAAEAEQPELLTESNLPVELRELSGRLISMQARLRVRNVVFATSSAHVGNSLVLFYPNGNRMAKAVPGSIKYIVTIGRSAPRFAVQRQQPVALGVIDPFQPYHDFPAKLYSSQLHSSLDWIDVDWVDCHYARYPMSSQHVAVLSLSRND